MQIIENRLEKKTVDECPFLIQMVDEVETDRPAVPENITCHDCAYINATGKCAFPAKLCEFKRETEEMINWVQAAIRGGE